MEWIRAMASDNPPPLTDYSKLTIKQRCQLRKKGVPVPFLPLGTKKGTRIGEKHPLWKGDAASLAAGRMRAGRMYRNVGPCTRCGAEKGERHHIDSNPLNNEPDNIAILCRRCHQAVDGRREGLIALSKLHQPKGAAATKRKFAEIRRLNRK